VKADVWDDIFPKPGGGAFDVVPRSLRTPFIEEWTSRRDEVAKRAESLQSEVGSGINEGAMERFVPFTGQSAGLIGEILPAAEIVRGLISQAEEILQQAGRLSR
jgi:nitronate monooxygenase/enoyl-[acyl-carrier protein] reductase II